MIWLHYKPLDGATECMDILKKTGKKVTFVTNNAISSRDIIRSKLRLNNFDSSAEIVNPVCGIIAYLQSINFNKMLYVLASEEFKIELRNAGFSLLPDPVGKIITSILIVKLINLQSIIICNNYFISNIKNISGNYFN